MTVAAKEASKIMTFQDELVYYSSDGKTKKGSVLITTMRGCQKVDEEAFDKSCMFQVMFQENKKLRILYLKAKNEASRRQWMESIRKQIDLLVGRT